MFLNNDGSVSERGCVLDVGVTKCERFSCFGEHDSLTSVMLVNLNQSAQIHFFPFAKASSFLLLLTASACCKMHVQGAR